MPRTRRPGLTLLEMVVVLTILAVLTTLAVTLTGSTVDQARFDATQRQIQGVNDAILGPIGQPDAPSFVSDTGRLPLGYVDPSDSSGEVQLTELWSNPNALPAFGPYVPTVDGTGATLPTPVPTVLSGWRGPYLTLPPGQNRLRDGWGNPFFLLQTDGTTAAIGGLAVGQMHSPGGPNAPYNVYQSAPINALSSGSIVSTFGWTATVNGSVQTAPSGTVVVKMFVPDVSKTPPLRVMTCKIGQANAYGFGFPVKVDSVNTSPDSDSTLPVPIGRIALQVHQNGSPVGPVTYIALQPGGTTRTLFIPN